MDMSSSMKLDAERNEVAHADMNELARSNQWLKLAVYHGPVYKAKMDIEEVEPVVDIEEEGSVGSGDTVVHRLIEMMSRLSLSASPLDDKGKAVQTSVRPAPTPRAEPVMDIKEEGSVRTSVRPAPTPRAEPVMDIKEEGSVGSVDTVVHGLTELMSLEFDVANSASPSSRPSSDSRSRGILGLQ
ncbi:hypothetical protein B0T24DRAFT_599342 [Lasiosphaeria ovina]|uniref:Uncharacterized protein n=1 Tax=Lasiosphaeria ovina TaxID=92902 RepID=A0AAE0JTJ8_9PEZI|nr:hypothetical protein B0T24DRAFT_599342 [Lasiosphaeria ovina]